MMQELRICHITSAHPRDDVRIYHKMVSSLYIEGHDIMMVVCDGNGNDYVSIPVRDLGKFNSRVSRFLFAGLRVLRNRSVYKNRILHFHDPELLVCARILKAFGFTVYFDAHEDWPSQIMTKGYLPEYSRRFLSSSARLLESIIFPSLDGVIAATPAIERKLAGLTQNVACINNYPILDEFFLPSENSRKNEVIYAGNFNLIRGFKEVCESVNYLSDSIGIAIAGSINKMDIGELIFLIDHPKINYLGSLSRKSLSKRLESSLAGIVTFLPSPNHLEAQPNKLFEYMAAGLPVIASDFPLWREIVQKNECGLLVNPESPRDIAKAINFLESNPKEARRMGLNGRKAIENQFNWDSESNKLSNLYLKCL